jgi:hypothetical protein
MVPLLCMVITIMVAPLEVTLMVIPLEVTLIEIPLRVLRIRIPIHKKFLKKVRIVHPSRNLRAFGE